MEEEQQHRGEQEHGDTDEHRGRYQERSLDGHGSGALQIHEAELAHTVTQWRPSARRTVFGDIWMAIGPTN